VIRYRRSVCIHTRQASYAPEIWEKCRLGLRLVGYADDRSTYLSPVNEEDHRAISAGKDIGGFVSYADSLPVNAKAANVFDTPSH
jgi:hypothetical protein